MRLYASSIFPAILSAASMSSKRARYSARFESWRSIRKLSRPLLRSLTLRLDSPSYSPSAMSTATTFIETINTEYEKVHKSFELQFWGTKMALGGEAYSVPELTRTKAEMEVVRLRLTHTGAHASHASLMRVGRARVSPPQAFLASKEKLAAQLAEVEKHKAAAAEAAAAVAQRNKDLQDAQEKKQKQGEIVDNTVHVARKAMVEQAKIYQEEDKLRAEMFLSLKVAVLSAGLSAMD
jgi:hypothetical protein